ncbi:hypothetical protein XENOCAPTIV_024080, partial [Xenoophorus captivus]
VGRTMARITTQRWFIGTLLKEKEDLFPDTESQGMNDDTYEYRCQLQYASICSVMYEPPEFLCASLLWRHLQVGHMPGFKLASNLLSSHMSPWEYQE